MERKKIIIAGGSGSLGSLLSSRFLGKGYDVRILSRRAGTNEEGIPFTIWDGKNSGKWSVELEGAEAVINLNGRTVNCRYTEKNKKEILDTRVDSTNVIGMSIARCSDPPAVWINASSAAIYGDGPALKDESSAAAEGFSPDVCRQWENALWKSRTPLTRKIALRIGLVLTVKGGVLNPLFHLARYGLAGTIGSGRQYMSWIHEDDFFNVVELCRKDMNMDGAINCCSPMPVTNAVFMKALRNAAGIPFGIPAPSPLVKAAAFFMGTEAELMLKGRKVVSRTLEEKKYSFCYGEIENAMKDIIKKRKQL